MPGLTFNGSTNFARATPAVTALPLTMFWWFFPTSLAATQTIGGLTNGTDLHRMVLLCVATTGLFQASAQSATGAAASSVNAATVNAWNSVAGIFTSDTSRKVIGNGDKANGGTASTSAASMTTPTRKSIGCRDSSTQSSFFTGTIGFGALWNVALTDDEVVAAHGGFPLRRIRPEALKGLWFGPGVGAAVQDIVGNDMAITGASATPNSPPVGWPI